MFDAAFKALQQMVSPPFRSVLIKSMLLALLMIILIGTGLYKFLDWLTVSGGVWAESALGPNAHTPLSWIIWIASIASANVLMPSAGRGIRLAGRSVRVRPPTGKAPSVARSYMLKITGPLTPASPA